MKQRWALIGAGVILALAAFAAGLFLSRPAAPPVQAELPAPEAVQKLFDTPMLDAAGQRTSLARWKGKPLLVNFWATWCPPCLVEMPAFSRLQEKHNDVQFVGIAVDSAENVQKFSAAKPVSYPLLVGGENVMPLMAQLGNNRNGLPFTLILDGNGQVRHIRLGGLSETEAEKLISSLR
ncbi:MAG TPA: TlpA disulfide reductase family protein [Rhodocyclaceae bacterium]|nr:TlpA disulfide reductase family protein [Rhodocyclaceae bacterium]